jgi:hypothetical protein
VEAGASFSNQGRPDPQHTHNERLSILSEESARVGHGVPNVKRDLSGVKRDLSRKESARVGHGVPPYCMEPYECSAIRGNAGR